MEKQKFVFSWTQHFCHIWKTRVCVDLTQILVLKSLHKSCVTHVSTYQKASCRQRGANIRPNAPGVYYPLSYHRFVTGRHHPGNKNHWPIIRVIYNLNIGQIFKNGIGAILIFGKLVDIGIWYRPNNNIVIYPRSPEYFVNIDLILSCSLKEHWLNNQFLILKSPYWLDTQKYQWVNIQKAGWYWRNISTQ